MNGADDERLAAMKTVFAKGSIREMEKLMILNRLSDLNDNRTRAAKSLDISVRTLRNKLHEYKDQGKTPAGGEHPVEVEEEMVPILG
jgi:transcriptional regulator with PAS, ATPase and Fis domain